MLRSKGLSVFWLEARLFAQFVCSDSVKRTMSFHGNGFIVVGIDRVIAAFSEHIEPVVLHVLYKITPFDGHSNLYRYLLKKSMPGWYCFTLLTVGLNHFPYGILKH